MAFKLIFASDVIVRETRPERGINFGRIDGALYERHYEPTTIYLIIKNISSGIKAIIPTPANLVTIEKGEDESFHALRILMDNFAFSRRDRLWPLRSFLRISSLQHGIRWSLLRGLGRKFSDRFIFTSENSGMLNIPADLFIEVIETDSDKVIWKK